MKHERNMKIKECFVKQLEVGFLKVTDYPGWLENIVPAPKKDEKLRMCVNYRYLSKASPKDNFSLLHINVVVENTAGHAMFSFMDGFSGYNHIRMSSKNHERTSIIIPCNTFYYKVIAFSLKRRHISKSHDCPFMV